jgi:hypothetical protein
MGRSEWGEFGRSRAMVYLKIALFVVSLISLSGCASTGANPYGESYEPDSPALPIDPHPAQPASFSNRTEHTTLSD